MTKNKWNWLVFLTFLMVMISCAAQREAMVVTVPSAPAGWNSVDDAVADTTMTRWTNFAKTGNSSTADFTWPAYTKANDTFVEISTKLEVTKGLAKGF